MNKNGRADPTHGNSSSIIIIIGGQAAKLSSQQPSVGQDLEEVYTATDAASVAVVALAV